MDDLSKFLERLEKADWKILLDGPVGAAARELKRQMKKDGLDLSDREAREWVREARKKAR